VAHRNRSVWTAVLPLILIASVLPQAVLAMDRAPLSSVYAPNPYNADFGDLPDTYLTTYAVGGAHHDNVTAFRLGAAVDTEYSGVPTITALGDDAAGSIDDEDGVSFAPPTECAGATLQFTVTVTGGSGTLGAWFDWNQNGRWDSGEGTSQPVVEGSNVLTAACPVTFDNKGVLNARFRLYEGAPSSLSPSGGVTNGEVEDYTWTFSTTAVRLVGLGGRGHFALLPLLAAISLEVAGAFGLKGMRRRRSGLRER